MVKTSCQAIRGGLQNYWQVNNVKMGAYAELILVDGNPLEDIDLVADPDNNFALIMKDGQIYKNTI